MPGPLAISELLAELGFDTADAQNDARAALQEAGLTRPGKTGIDCSKRARVEEVLRARFVVTCGSADCGRDANGRRAVRASSPTGCWVCAGSANRRMVDLAREAFLRHGVQRLVVVGGSPAVHEELRQLAPSDWELRIVDGTQRRTLELAKADLRWAQLVLIWGSSELDHKVSTLYTRDGPGRHRVISVGRRGIAALLEGAVEHLSRR